MSVFDYEAVDARGRIRRGEIEAPSEHRARSLLKARGLVPRKLVTQASTHAADHPKEARRYRLNTEESTAFFESLGTLLTAGVPLAEALSFVSEGMESRQARRLVVSMRQQVLEGGSLAQAMRTLGFSEVACNMVAAGEETGQLHAVAERLAELLERQRQLRQDLLSATLYPMIVTSFGFLVLIFLLVVVMPQIIGVFSRVGGELPWLTQAIISVSGFLREHGLSLLLVLLALTVVVRLALRMPSWRRRFDRLVLALPWLGTLLRKIETGRFARTLGMLLAGGVPVLPAMHIAAQSVAMVPFRESIARAKDAVREGGSLAEELEKGGHAPHMATRLIAVGEQAGRLDEMLLRVADYFENDAARNLKRFVTLLEPVLVLLMALMVGTLALAILLPIMEMNELLR